MLQRSLQPNRSAVALDERGGCRASRERLESHRPRARVEIEEPRADHLLPEDVEERLADQRPRGPHLEARWRVDDATAPLPCGDARLGRVLDLASH
jgi:hypothetical protein